MKKKNLLLTILTTTALFLSSNLISPNTVKRKVNFDITKTSFEKLTPNLIGLLKDTISLALGDMIGAKEKVKDLNNNTLQVMEVFRKRNNLPLDIYYRLIYTESQFNGEALSPVGARGYFQLMKCAYDQIRIVNSNLISSYEVQTEFDNIYVGSAYLKYLKNAIDSVYHNLGEVERWKLVLASYNAGFGAVVNNNALVEYSETRNYVATIMSSRIN